MDSTPTGTPVLSLEHGLRQEAEHPASGISSSPNQNTVDLSYEHIPPEAGKKSTDAGHGNRFQSKLLILYAIRATNFGFPFYLGTELPVGDKFDDLIFHYKDDNDDASVIQKDVTKTPFRQQYLQAKHRLNEQVGITADQLINTTFNNNKNQDTKRSNVDTGDFSLLKYFQSYVKIKRKGNNVEHCIICTNVDFNHRDIEINGITLERVDDKNLPKLLDNKDNPQEVKKDQTCYKLKIANDKFKSISSDRMRTWVINFTKDEIKYLFENCIDEMITSFFVNCQDKVHEKPLSDHTADEIKDIFDNLKDKKEIQNFFQNYGETIVACIFEGFLVCFLDDFLEKLIFSVNMPNEDELDLVLVKEVGKYFKLTNAALPSAYIMNEMVNWFKRQENDWLTPEKAKEILDKSTQNLIAIDQSTYRSIDYQNRLKQRVQFNNTAVEKLTCVLNLFWENPSQKVMKLNSETPKLTAVKVFSAIENMTNFPNKDDYLVISSKRDDLREFFNWQTVKKCHQILVIVDEDAKNPLKDFLFYENLIPEENNKRIIFISNQIGDDESYQDTIVYESFSNETKESIEKKQVSFQGIILTINKLMDMNLADKIMDSQLIENVLETANNILVPLFDVFNFEESFYIKRKMKFPSKDCWNNELVKEMDSNLEEDIHIDSNGKIRWLVKDYERKSEIWEDFKDLLDQKYSLNITSISDVNEEELVKTNNKRIIITGVAGTGKSTILSNYYKEIKSVKPDILVVKFSLMNYSRALKEIEEVNENSINEFLLNNVIGQSLFARSLLKHRMETGDRIILMLDGFDEIDTKCQNKVIEIVQNINESIPIYITTRPHLAGKLEFELSQLSYSLVKFTKDDQIAYFTSIWKDFLKEERIYEEIKIQTFAMLLIDRLEETLKDQEKEFIGIPLQCRILAESFQLKIKDQIIQKPNEELDLSHLLDGQQFDLASLYKMMMVEKQRVFEEKIKVKQGDSHIVDDSIKKTIKNIELHLIKLAVQTIVVKQEYVNIFFPDVPSYQQSEFDRKNEEKELNENGVRFGLLDENSAKGMRFLHKTYAEYLVADHIFNGFHLDEDRHNKLLENKFIRKWIIEKMLVKDQYEGVRVFLNSMLKEIIGDEWKNKIKERTNLPKRLEQFSSFLWDQRKEKKWAFSKACRGRNANILLLILNCLDSTFNDNNSSEIQSVISESIRDPFQQRDDVFHRILTYFSDAEDSQLESILFKLFINGFWNQPIGVKQENIKHLLNFMDSTLEQRKQDGSIFFSEKLNSRYNLNFMTHFFIENQNDDLSQQYFKILSFCYSQDSSLIHVMKDPIIKCLDNQDCKIDHIQKTLTIFQDIGRINVIPELSRLVIVKISENLNEEKNEPLLWLEKMGMTGLHEAAFKGDLKTIEKEIGCCFENPETLSKKDRNAVFGLLTHDKHIVSPFDVAAACGQNEICRKILIVSPIMTFRDEELLFHTLDDAITKYKNVVMVETILRSVRAAWGESALTRLLNSLMNEMYEDRVMVETITRIVAEDESNGCQSLNNIFFKDEFNLNSLKHIQSDNLQRMIFAAGGFDCWIKRLMDTSVTRAFDTLSAEGFLDKFDIQFQIPKLIDIIVTKRPSPSENVSSSAAPSTFTSYWSDFLKYNQFVESFLTCGLNRFSEDDLKRLLFYRDENSNLILFRFYVQQESQDRFSHLSDWLNLKKETEDIWKEETPRMIDHFFSSPIFLATLQREGIVNAIEYYLENGNEEQLSKFIQVVNIHQFEFSILHIDGQKCKKFKKLIIQKLDSETATHYKRAIENAVKMKGKSSAKLTRNSNFEFSIRYSEYTGMLTSYEYEGDI